ncbi:MAG: 3-isopropylmalate dehydratase small subunit [Gammaproteobacteria bacterium]|nr:3-isopropylmalate dehydratase small subunit [Gammaproteobacteria bacterium]
MESFTKMTSSLLPLDRPNVDTDAIIPKQYLKSIKKSGFGVNLFDDWRYLDPGEPDQDNSQRRIDADFILNNPQYKNAQVLLARDNFGCGSSREHAVWAMLDYGFRAVLSTSFADIFFSNCFKNGLLPIALEKSAIDKLFEKSLNDADYQVSIDLEKQQVVAENIGTYDFDIDEFKKHCMLNGLDEIGITLQYKDKIHAYEDKLKKKSPWLFAHD